MKKRIKQINKSRFNTKGNGNVTVENSISNATKTNQRLDNESEK